VSREIYLRSGPRRLFRLGEQEFGVAIFIVADGCYYDGLEDAVLHAQQECQICEVSCVTINDCK
jgi:hypothetical protein